MTVVQLQYIISVMECQSFTLAAKKCYVTQPTLSMQIQKLEDELDIKIFDRQSHPIQPTPIGAKLIEKARKAVNNIHQIKEFVAQEKGVISGEFRLAIIPTVMSSLLPIFIKEFTQTYPLVTLKIEELHTQDIIKKLNKGEIDAAIAATPLEEEKLEQRVLYKESILSFVPKNHKLFSQKEIEIEDLQKNKILLLEEGHCFRENALNLCDGRQQLQKIDIKSSGFDTLIALSNIGMGMTLIPQLYVNRYMLDKKCVKRFKNLNPAREISLIYHEEALKLNIMNNLFHTIVDQMKLLIEYKNVDVISPLKKNN